MPILLRTENAIKRLAAQPFDDEKQLENLLAGSPDLLDDSEPECEACRVALVAQQVSLPNADRLDLLFITDDGLPIAVEVKLARNGEVRRQVVAQAIDYISSLSLLTVEELDDFVHTQLSKALGEFKDVDTDQVWKEIDKNLRAGRARLVVAVDEPPADLQRLLRFLARSSELDVRLLAVERYRAPGGGDVFVPRMIVNPDSEPGPRSLARARTLEELMVSCQNEAEAKFFRDMLREGRRMDSKRSSIAFPQTGTIHWYAECGSARARIVQVGRFKDDEYFWKEHISEPESVAVVRNGNNMRFYLKTAGDFEFFREQMNKPQHTFDWTAANPTLPASARAGN